MMRFPHGAPDFHAKSNGEGGGEGRDSAHRGRGVSKSGDQKLQCVNREAGDCGGGGRACMGKLVAERKRGRWEPGIPPCARVRVRDSRVGMDRDGWR